MRSLFDRITRFSIRYRWLTIGAAITLMALGVYAALALNIELVPSIEIPSTYILARSHGSTSGDLMLEAYSLPIEQGAARIDGVVNRESTTTTGFAFLDIRNEYGLDQAQLREELTQVIHNLSLPLRTITLPAGLTPADMIGQLTPDQVLYLHAYSLENGVPFLTHLDPAVWRQLSPEVLGALPDSVFDEIDQALASPLRSRRVGTPQPLPDPAQTEPPALPESWQMDRFVTVADLIELTGVRDLADLFNEFVTDGRITGPLGTTADITAADLQLLLDLENRCRASQAGSASNGSDSQNCSLLGYLDGAGAAALLSQFQGTEEADLAAEAMTVLGQEDRNQVAAASIAQLLTGRTAPRDVLLPEEWRLEPPQLITFSMNDIPLGILSVSAEDAAFSRDELRRLVENEVIPRLESLDSVANVTVEGGEEIRPDLLNDALQAEGLEPVSLEAADGSNQGEAQAGAGDENPGSAAAAAPPLEEGPALPRTWALFATQIPGVEELDTADDLLKIQGIAPSQLFNQAAAMATDNPAISPIVERAIGELSPDVLLYLAAHEDGFFDNLSLDVLRLLPADTLAQLPPDVQQRAAIPPSPALGTLWQRLASEPELAGVDFATAYDLNAFGDGAADTLNRLVTATPASFQFYAIQLVNDLSPDVIGYWAQQDESFLTALRPEVYCYFSADVLQAEIVQQVWSGQEWTCQRGDERVALADIASGAAETAAQTLIVDETEARVHDPNAPALPASWPGIAGYLGAEELDTADDLFYTSENGQPRTPSQLMNAFVGQPGGEVYIAALTPDVLNYVTQCAQPELCEPDFFNNLSDPLLLMLSDETASELPPDVQARRSAARLGTYEPEELVTRTNGNNSLILQLRKDENANTVSAWADVEKVLRGIEDDHPGLHFEVAFEQASYIEESISGVAREGGLGAVMAVIVILIFLNFSVRSTLVTAVSIPTSVALAFVLMRWVPGNVHAALAPLANDAHGLTKNVLDFVLRLFPEDISLNIMTLSGLTVAIGRVVDDAIVVLENIYRNIQKGEDQLEAVLQGTRDVSVAIFAATVTTVVVFLPIGLFGGVIGAFFLPFGLAVTYALLSSFVVAITVVPLLAYLFISKSSLPAEHHSSLERGYGRAIRWALNHRWIVMGVATLAFVLGMLILSGLPTAFLPSFGEPQITVSVSLPRLVDGRPLSIAVTDAKVRALEARLRELPGIETVQSSVGGAGNAFVASEGVSENTATVTISVKDQDTLDRLTPLVRREAEAVFNDMNHDGVADEGADYVKVSGASLSEQGFGGFAVVVSGSPENPPTLAELQQYDALIMEKLSSIEGITNVESSLESVTGSGGDVSQTYIRIDGIPAVRYTAELETNDTLGVTAQAIKTLQDELDLPPNLTVSEGYESQQQTEGFQQTFVSMGIAVVVVYIVMLLTFGSLIHPITILFSLPLAVVGAAVGLAVTGRVLGLSSVVGLLMLVGIVVTNAIVLIDRVQTNRKQRGMDAKTALADAGSTRLRPILMTAIATMVALLPLAIGLSQGAIIAAELGTVVIGGLFSSTLLTLVVVPVVYSLFDQVQSLISRRVRRRAS